MAEPTAPIDPAREYSLLWRRGPRPDLRRFLSAAGDLEPRQVAAILHIDQRERWAVGERVAACDYLRDFATLRADAEAAFELIYDEFLLREELGEAPTPEEYRRAYPEHAERLAIQIELHRALAGTTDHGSCAGAMPSGEETVSGFLGRPPQASGVASLPTVRGYELLEELGRGGMGIVYKARELWLNRIVALKMIRAGDLADHEARLRFLHEAEVIARLRHPNIVQIFDIGEKDGHPFVELEFVEGGSLDRRLDGTPWPAREAARLLETLARAVDEAHRRGVVHRDLKPANVLLDAAGVPKVSDFGLAKSLVADSGLTPTDWILGTPSYMAPEQASGRAKRVGPAADIYALGVILYELLTGRSPFRGDTPLETLEQVRSLQPVPPRLLRPKLARDLETICLKCLEKDPARRYPDARALADDLRRYLLSEPIVARASNPLDRLMHTLRRGQHDREFRTWGRYVLPLTLFCTLPHLVVFASALAAPERLLYAYSVPWIIFIATVAFVFRANRTRIRMPSIPAMRHLGALLIALIITSNLLNVIAYMLGNLTTPVDGLKLYPTHALLTGQMIFSLGGSYWGRCYLAGLGFFLAALLMPLNLTWAPLEMGVAVFLAFGAIGLHLRRLGREDGELDEGKARASRPAAADQTLS